MALYYVELSSVAHTRCFDPAGVKGSIFLGRGRDHKFKDIALGNKASCIKNGPRRRRMTIAISRTRTCCPSKSAQTI